MSVGYRDDFTSEGPEMTIEECMCVVYFCKIFFTSTDQLAVKVTSHVKHFQENMFPDPPAYLPECQWS